MSVLIDILYMNAYMHVYSTKSICNISSKTAKQMTDVVPVAMLFLYQIINPEFLYHFISL